MKLRIGTLSITASTDKGEYGVEHKFEEGMNILRAENAAGKSTVLRAIIYALGLEGMLSPSYDVPLPHVLTEYVDLPVGRALVSSAHLTLEIHNESNDSMTVTRAIAGPRDKRLVSVRDGSGITDPNHAGPSSDFYVRTAGAARSERGFHARLASFIGWELPEVSSFDADPVLLYMETIFPLFTVEQKLGWGRIPARFPTWLNIKDVRRRTIEFMLALDAYVIAEERLAIRAEISRIKHAWNETREIASKRAIANGAILNSMPREPIPSWPPEPGPQIYLGTPQNGWEALPSHIEKLRAQKQTLDAETVPTAGAQDESLRPKLDHVEEEISQRELVLRQSLEELETEISEAESLEEHIQSVEEDQRKYKELRKLRRLGADNVAEVIHGTCPTCNQEISDSLMDLGQRATTMSVDQNISFYDEQLQLSRAVLENTRKETSATEAQIASTREHLNRLRAELRSIRETLSSPANTPSIQVLTERLRLDQRIDRLEELKDFFLDAVTTFANMSDEWAAVQERFRKLPKGNLSPMDLTKLKALEESLQKQLRLYGFGSVDPSLVTINTDYYEPELAEMNLAADAAASDVIRLQWAYLIALMEVSMKFGGRHPKMLMFDEPQQQSTDDGDFFKMLRYLAGIPGAQAIVATSHERASIKLLAGQESNVDLWELGDEKVITKKP